MTMHCCACTHSHVFCSDHSKSAKWAALVTSGRPPQPDKHLIGPIEKPRYVGKHRR